MTKIVCFKELLWNFSTDTIMTEIKIFKMFELTKLCRNCTVESSVSVSERVCCGSREGCIPMISELGVIFSIRTFLPQRNVRDFDNFRGTKELNLIFLSKQIVEAVLR